VGVYVSAWIGIGAGAREQQSFVWWVVNRLLFLAAVGSIQGFAQFYLQDVLQIPNAATMTTVLLAVVALFLMPSALGGGYLADRWGRKRLVGLAGLIAAAGTMALLLARSMTMVVVSGCIIGLGTGLFMATNWALGTDLAPAEDVGRYLGISNLAGAGAGIVGAGIGGPLADRFNALEPGLGYLVIFGIYGVLFLLSTLALTRIHTPHARGRDLRAVAK
jgi:MFS family permease